MNLNDTISSRLRKEGTVNIAIAGSTCSGKTTLANTLQEDFSQKHSVTIIKQDDYFKDFCDLPRGRHGKLLDSPEAFYVREFRQDVQELLTTFKTTVPRYDVSTNKRIAKDKPVNLGQINIFEGLHTINLLNEHKNFYRIFLDTEIETCLKRRIERDTALYGVSAKKVYDFFRLCILPMYDEYILPQINHSDLVIKGNKI